MSGSASVNPQTLVTSFVSSKNVTNGIAQLPACFTECVAFFRRILATHP
jgi:hypothetical protein